MSDQYEFLTPGTRLCPDDEVCWNGEWRKVYSPYGFSGSYRATATKGIRFRRKIDRTICNTCGEYEDQCRCDQMNPEPIPTPLTDNETFFDRNGRLHQSAVRKDFARTLEHRIIDQVYAIESLNRQQLRDSECIERITKHGLELEVKCEEQIATIAELESELSDTKMALATYESWNSRDGGPKELIEKDREIARLRDVIKEAIDISRGDAGKTPALWNVEEYLVKALSFAPGEVSSIPCAICSGSVVEFSIPNDVWNRVVRLDGPETDKEYLCMGCYLKAVESFVRVTESKEVL